MLLSTGFGVGCLPKAPGTFGALLALPFAWGLVRTGGPWALLIAATVTFALGLWAIKVYMAAEDRHDPPSVVIDEMVGQWLTLAFAPLDPLAYLLGFLLFRVADIVKPWPVGWLDRRVGGAFGVLIDDVAAGVYAGVALFLVLRVAGP